MNKDTAVSEFSAEEMKVVQVNIKGPFVHGVWANDFEAVGNEEALTGRAGAIVSNFVRVLKDQYSDAEISEMTLLDVGCYDGFLTTEIEKRATFKSIVGAEPREKNIQKGVAVRQYLDIDTSVKFIVADLDILVEKKCKFDIVFCSGVFHHLEDHSAAVRKLRGIAKKAVFIETQCYPDTSNSLFGRWLKRCHLKNVEPKDIIYQFESKQIGILGTKFETNYYDGSATSFSVVALPSPTHLLMLLRAADFSEPRVTLSPREYKRHISSKLRKFSAVCVFATVEPKLKTSCGDLIDLYSEKYEIAQLRVCREIQFLRRLINSKVLMFIYGRPHSAILQSAINNITKLLFARSDFLIIQNVKYAPQQKVDFEIAKWEMHFGDIATSIKIFKRLLTQINCDWRVSYRACYYLSWAYEIEGETKKASYFESLCLIAHPNFPKSLFDQYQRRLISTQ